MRLICSLVITLVMLFPVQGNAQSSDDSKTDSVEAYFRAARDPETDFLEAYDEARAAGVDRAQLLAGRMINFLKVGDLQGLLNQLDKVEELRAEFRIGYDPKGQKVYSFISERELEGLISALKAVRSFQDEDYSAFEMHVKNCYWNWPQWAGAFQLERLVQQLRQQEMIDAYISDLVLPLDSPLRDLNGEALTLGELVDGNKALLLDFWASWCGPCMRLMPELQKRAVSLSEQGVYVAGVNTDQEEPLEKAAAVKKENNMDMPWLVEAEGMPLSQALMVDSIPRVVLIAPDGRVLFSGHPLDAALGDALQELGVDLPAES